MRRWGIAFALVLIVAGVWPTIAVGETEAELKSQLEALKSQSRRAGDSYDQAHWALDETEVRLAQTDKRLALTRRKLSFARRRLNARAAQMYRRDALDLLGFLVGSSTFGDFVVRLSYLERIGVADAQAIFQVKTLEDALRGQRTQLAAERRSRKAAVTAFTRRRDALQERLKSVESEYLAVKDRLDVVRSGGRVPSGVAAVAGPNGMVFPVVGSYYYSDTWGASRSGGRRRHQGTDIMAPRGTPVVAILSGRVRSKTNNLGGKTIWLTADNGWEFYYAHLDSWVITSGRVRAGQVIATVGSTGNASASAPHLHFEIHPGGGPVNPYPYLREME